ncbi:hypothetical protein, partial [Escherichia coli]
DGQWRHEGGLHAELPDAERAAADWAWQHEQPAGLGTDTLPASHWWWWPLCAEEGPLLLIGLQSADGTPLADERRRLVAALGQPLA